MYEFITHTWNTVKGACYHDCVYCYMKSIAKRYKKPQPPPFFDEKELKTNLGNGNFIFVGSSNDLFASNIPEEWIEKTLEHCDKFDNKYLLQTKNPARFEEFSGYFRSSDILVTTLETNRHYPIMENVPHPYDRVRAMERLNISAMITIEPIMDFDFPYFVEMIKQCKPQQVNIGADSGNNNLPEPSKEEVLELISELEKFTIVKQKSNLSRLLK